MSNRQTVGQTNHFLQYISQQDEVTEESDALDTRPYLTVQIKNSKFRWLFDSGSQITCIHSKFLKNLNVLPSMLKPCTK